MRIISGKWKGRKIDPPSSKWPVRPTTDFAREALFNILDNRLDYEKISSLDLFGGTGIHAIELASRGCQDVTYVDRFRESVKFMNSLIKEWRLPVTAIQSDVMAFLKKETRKWDYIFADPPYDFDDTEELIRQVRKEILAAGGLFVLEHAAKKKWDAMPGFIERRQYGQTIFSFFDAGS